jgi:hypothetical protein
MKLNKVIEGLLWADSVTNYAAEDLRHSWPETSKEMSRVNRIIDRAYHFLCKAPQGWMSYVLVWDTNDGIGCAVYYNRETAYHALITEIGAMEYEGISDDDLLTLYNLTVAHKFAQIDRILDRWYDKGKFNSYQPVGCNRKDRWAVESKKIQ